VGVFERLAVSVVYVPCTGGCGWGIFERLLAAVSVDCVSWRLLGPGVSVSVFAFLCTRCLLLLCALCTSLFSVHVTL
jgi:hypothetical protein